MRGLPHAAIGAASGVLLGSLIQSDPLVTGGLAALGALLPDLDHEGSLASRIPIVGTLSSMMVRLTSNILSALRPVPNPFPNTIAGSHLTHRGPFHAPFMAAFLYVALSYAGLDHAITLALICGYVSHLICDEGTHMGLPLLWPVYPRVIRLPHALTWRSGTAWIEWPVAAAAVYLVYAHVYGNTF